MADRRNGVDRQREINVPSRLRNSVANEGRKAGLRLRGDRDSKEGITVPVMEGDPSLADAHSEEVATA